MIGTSKIEYVFIRICIFVLLAITPSSFTYWLLRPFLSEWAQHPYFDILDVWFATEICFYLFVYLPLRQLCQRKAIHPPIFSQSERARLFAKCHQTICAPDQYVRKWFRDAPLEEIKRDNLKEFFTWGFFNSDETDRAYEDELDEFVTQFEAIAGRRLEPGKGKAQGLRLTTDPVYMVHRPFVWYTIMALLDVTTHCTMLLLGFHFYRPSVGMRPTTFPLRPLTLLGSTSPTDILSYWYRPHKSRTKLPVLFVHGIGIGLLTYELFLAELNKASRNDEDIGIIAVELLPISFRITHAAVETGLLCREVQNILSKHGFDKVVLVSHSYGSVVTTHLLKHETVSRHISAVVLVDPVSFLLHLPDVAYNFVYRKPKRANEWQLWYFASTDIGVAHTLARSFFWSENILWKEDLGDRPTTVFLAGQDLIVNTAAVAAYLSDGDSAPSEEVQKHGKRTAKPGKVQVIWCEELDHASIFQILQRRCLLVDAVLKACSTGHEHKQ